MGSRARWTKRAIADRRPAGRHWAFRGFKPSAFKKDELPCQYDGNRKVFRQWVGIGNRFCRTGFGGITDDGLAVTTNAGATVGRHLGLGSRAGPLGIRAGYFRYV